MNEILLRPAEFAYLCATTKETLRHYHELGLIRPAHTAENGYRYYSITQMLDFLLIAALRSVGCSLEEIRGYLTTPSPGQLRQVLDGALTTLGQKRREIEHQQRLLKNTLARLDLLERLPAQGPYRVEQCPEEHYIETPMGTGAEPTLDSDIRKALREHLSYCRDHSSVREIQLSYRIGLEAFRSGDYLRDISLCSRASRPSAAKRLHVKPKGSYLKLLRILAVPEKPDEAGMELADAWFADFERFKEYAAKNGYRIIGDTYETELSIYTGNARDSFYVEIAALIEPPNQKAN
jgi:DNA-binding transcriptional MerR regulator